MRNIKIILATLFLVTGMQGFSQIKKANRQFELYKYARAIPLYLKAAESRDDVVKKEATIKLADCYRFTNDVAEARSWYQRVTEFNDIEPVNFYYLGQAARSLQDYDQAKAAFEKYATLVPDDPKGKLYAGYCALMAEWSKKSPSAEVKNADNLNSTYSDFGPVFFEKGIVYTSDRNPSLLENKRYGWTNFNYLNLFQADPKYYKDFWGPMHNPTPMSSKFNQSYHDGPASFSDNFSKIFITRTVIDKVQRVKGAPLTYVLKIFYANLSEGKDGYIEFPYNSDSYSVGHPTISSDGKHLIFVSDKPGGSGGSDLYSSEFTGGKWSEPVNLGGILNSIGNEVFPTLVNDTLLYFASDGHPGYGGLDIFVSCLTNGGWSKPENLYAPVNSSYDDFAIAVSKDLKSGFFSSDRPGGKGSDDIYAFKNAVYPTIKEVENQQFITKNMNISGYVKDKTTRMPLAGAQVFVLNTKTNKVRILETNPEGFFTTPVEKDVLYVTKAVKPDYLTDCLNFKIDLTDTVTNQETPRDLLLDKLEVDKVFRVENIYYDLDKWFIREDAKPSLDNLVAILRQYPIRIELSSHTDCRASDEYNDELSQKRAEAAIRYIVLQGIDPSRLIAKGYGEKKLINKCQDGVQCTEEEHQANRRTEFKILSIDKPVLNQSLKPSLFKTGEEVDIYLFEPDFFNKCFETADTPENNQSALSGKTMSADKPSTETGLNNMVNNEICFGVQLLASASKISLTDPELKGIAHVQCYESGKWYKYIAGCEADYSNAVQLRKQIADKGFKDAFVVKIENGKIMAAR